MLRPALIRRARNVPNSKFGAATSVPRSAATTSRRTLATALDLPAATAASWESLTTPLRIGVLNTSEPHRDSQNDKPVFQWFQKVDSNLQLSEYRLYEGQWPKHLLEQDHYIVTGSSHSIYDERPWIAKLNSFLRSLLLHADPRGPRAIGVCFGHQAAVWVLNNDSGVGKSTQGWGVGLREVKMLPNAAQYPWMQPFVSTVRMCFSHQDVVQQLPLHSVERLATSEHCDTQMMLVRSPVTRLPKMFTFQGHVEYPREFMRASYLRRFDRIEKFERGRAVRALESLSANNNSDELTVTRWAINFLRAAPDGSFPLDVSAGLTLDQLDQFKLSSRFPAHVRTSSGLWLPPAAAAAAAARAASASSAPAARSTVSSPALTSSTFSPSRYSPAYLIRSPLPAAMRAFKRRPWQQQQTLPAISA